LTYTHRAKNVDQGRKSVVSASERVSFFPIYTLHDHSQVFAINNFKLDAPILAAAKTPNSVGPLKLDDKTIPIVKAICASFRSGQSLKVYFQMCERRRLLSTDWWTFLQGRDTFSRLDRPGFTIGDSIHAVYENGTLLFRSFAVVSRFISLIDLFNEASNDKIEEVLGHQVLHVADLDSVIEHADTIMRKQFAAVSELKTLDKVKPNVIKEKAADFDISIDVQRHAGKLKVEFPETKKDQKELLTFLTEGYYKGPLTGNKYQSNSHRPLKAKSKAT